MTENTKQAVEAALEEAKRVVHNAIHDAIYKINDCEPVKDAVRAALDDIDPAVFIEQTDSVHVAEPAESATDFNPEQVERLKRNLRETSMNEGSVDLACRCADSLTYIEQLEDAVSTTKAIGMGWMDRAVIAENRIAELESGMSLPNTETRPQMLQVALDALQTCAVSESSGEHDFAYWFDKAKVKEAIVALQSGISSLDRRPNEQSALGEEYSEWIRFYDAGNGSFGDFLKNKLAQQEGK